MTNEQNTDYFDNDGHLRTEVFHAMADGSTETESATLAHLSSCARCREHLAELRATLNLLHALPEPVPSRSFQIEVPPPAPASVPTPVAQDSGIAARIRSVLLPALPVLKAAALGIFLLFLTASAGDLWSSRDQETPSPAVLSTAATETPVLAMTALPGDEDASATDREAEPDAAAENASADQAPAPAPASGRGAQEADSSEFEAAPAAAQSQSTAATGSTVQIEKTSETASSATEASGTPTEVPEAGEQPETEPLAHNTDWSAWRIAQVLLLALLAALLAILAWLRWENRGGM